jgi:ABC-type antimicrobial peptide transport system permease subunit
MTFSIERRSHELGIRAALGARASDLRRLILSEGMSQIGLGLALGAVLGVALTRAIAAFLYGVEPWDPTVLAAVLGALALAGLLASLGPAARAGKADPAVALREE